MRSRFAANQMSVNAPALGAMAIDPSDSADLPKGVRAVTIAGAGVLNYLAEDGQTCTTGELPVGTYSPFARRILATGTTATKITGWM
ncbi:spike base protein, RCAP_Rcc01079 family [Falsirhodobacter deserti]|uniref:spike base protein, RCAP_Rcc01079 family n=1 Tax=Falsirhodobacter deserti TaxID=1365611 RepID=UPI000FE381BB|nr:hypothetical protein [Falsirhodobacter deserti]